MFSSNLYNEAFGLKWGANVADDNIKVMVVNDNYVVQIKLTSTNITHQ